ncbi:hypothetical protein DSO57_1010111 [Entomophthora muscae]|uniref:Uncharacterized protein n=1 Tax=Entomophthora muscae TaxID=34485 RepID=A0ACC2U5F2_9FUNG|nr:hypothetical protein DSO57_1010111 [Entomophthora muscae]
MTIYNIFCQKNHDPYDQDVYPSASVDAYGQEDIYPFSSEYGNDQSHYYSSENIDTYDQGDESVSESKYANNHLHYSLSENHEGYDQRDVYSSTSVDAYGQGHEHLFASYGNDQLHYYLSGELDTYDLGGTYSNVYENDQMHPSFTDNQDTYGQEDVYSSASELVNAQMHYSFAHDQGDLYASAGEYANGQMNHYSPDNHSIYDHGYVHSSESESENDQMYNYFLENTDTYEQGYLYSSESESENDQMYNCLSEDHSTLVLQMREAKLDFEMQPFCLANQQLQGMQTEIVNSVASISGLPFQICRALIREYHWDKHQALKVAMYSPSKAYKDCGIENPLISTQINFESQKAFTCNICCEDSQNQNTLTLQCGHEFCLDCHKTYYEQSISEGNVKNIHCPGSCDTLVQDETLQKVVSPASFSRFLKLQDDYFVDGNKNMKWCPSPNCKYVLQCDVNSLSSIVPSVFCNSGHGSCFNCDLEEHMPCLCSYAKAWLKKTQDDSETSNWILSNTKECPECHSAIEKNGGCRHMTCRKCKFEFCWICMEVWSGHSDRECVTFDEAERNESEGVTESRSSLEKYLHYYNRYVNHIQSSKVEQNLFVHTKGNRRRLQRTPRFSSEQVQFLKAAFNTLARCRNTLKWTYALAYYLNAGANKKLFQDNQQELELATEALSGLLEGIIKFKSLSQFEQKIQDKARYVSQRREILSAFIIQGYFEGLWEYAVDP